MKKHFNNLGVAQVMSQLLALPTGELASELQAMRTDFLSWMLDKFELSSSQTDQFSSLPPAFIEDMGSQIAQVLEQGGTFSFFKQEYASRHRDRDKDILLQPAKRTRYSFETETTEEVLELSIYIS